MTIDQDTVRYIAKLSQLDLSTDDVERFRVQLNNILTYVDTLQELDTTGVEPFTHPLATNNVLRSDEVKPSADRDETMKNAPDKSDGFYIVPKVVG